MVIPCGAAVIPMLVGCTTLEGFESGTWPATPWTSAASSGGMVSGAAAHDGSYVIMDPD